MRIHKVTFAIWSEEDRSAIYNRPGPTEIAVEVLANNPQDACVRAYQKLMSMNITEARYRAVTQSTVAA